jgi:predicted DNA-binding protein YlxM (UPF0122 family)
MANRKTNHKMLAMEYYMNSALSVGEIAKLIGVAERTVAKWAKEEKWQDVKKARMVSATNLQKLAYEVSNKFMQELAKKEEILVGDIDAISKMATSLDKIAGKNNLANHIATLTDFVNWVHAHHPNHAQDVAELAQKYIQHKQ